MKPAPSQDAVLRRAKRMDRIMALLISLGGLAIISAVLGMLFFIGKEAFPLFRGARSAERTGFTAPGALLLDESGKAAASLSPARGLELVAVPEGRALKQVATGPALPWSAVLPPGPRGETLVVDVQGGLQAGKVTWSKPAGDPDPAHWDLEAAWTAPLPSPGPGARVLAFRLLESGGLEGGLDLKVVAATPAGLLRAEAAPGSTDAAWQPVQAPGRATAAAWSLDGAQLTLGTAEGRLLVLDAASGEALAETTFPEPVSALGHALGGTSLLVGGEKGGLAAYHLLRTGERPQLQELHRFPSLDGPVLGFRPSLRDKRFLAWTSRDLAVDHLTTERRLLHARAEGTLSAALAPRGDLVTATDASGRTRAWSLDAPHPEVSLGTLAGKVHYEGYDQPAYVWQSSGGTDDFEPKLSLVPLVFGTLKGTLYAMLFALPMAILGALYTSQFASPRLRNAIKPTVEIMAALPSVVLGFLAGLVMAPLFEKLAVEVLVFPGVALVLAALAFPLWTRLPQRFRSLWGTGREVAWAIPLLAAAALLSLAAGPAFERAFLGGDYRHWLLSAQGITFDQRNSLVVGFAMGFAVIPIIFTLSEDALSSVPKSLTSASLACGASPWQTAWRVVLPTASPGIFSAVMVGLGRAIGETMIVLMATGNTPVLDWSPFNGMRTLSANIAVEIPEAPHHGTLYRVLFLAAFLLFLLTFLLNTCAELVRQRLRRKYESF
ncbi:MAG: ABC transporter permease subunit [Holophagaceae bacterium]